MRINNFKRITRNVSTNETISETIILDDGKRFSASEYVYGSRKFSERQENFYQNLIRLYLLLESKELPISFMDGNGNKWRLDKGCISMAVHDGFLAELKESSAGFVETVTLNW